MSASLHVSPVPVNVVEVHIVFAFGVCLGIVVPPPHVLALCGGDNLLICIPQPLVSKVSKHNDLP